MADKIKSLDEMRAELNQTNPQSLFDWLEENGKGLSSMEVLYLVVEHIDRLRWRFDGLKEQNGLWDGS